MDYASMPTPADLDALLRDILAESDDLNMSSCCARGLSARMTDRIRFMLGEPE